jgi:hypothetical protein
MFSFPESCRSGDELRLGWGFWGIFVFLPNVFVESFYGASVFESRGGWLVGGVTLVSYAVIVLGKGRWLLLVMNLWWGAVEIMSGMLR